MQHSKKPSRFESGQSLMEMALTLPIILLLIMGIMDFGRMLFQYSLVASATREAARYGSVTGIFNANAGEVQQFRDCIAIRQAVRDKLALPLDIPDSAIDITYDDGKNLMPFNCNGTVGPPANAILPGYRIRVKVDTTFTFITPFMSSFVPGLNVSFNSARTILVGGTLAEPPVS